MWWLWWRPVFFSIAFSAWFATRIQQRYWVKQLALDRDQMNVGLASYELQENGLRFNGSTFDAFVPYASIKAVEQHNDNFILLSNGYGFWILPQVCNVTEGSLTDFVSCLRDKLLS